MADGLLGGILKEQRAGVLGAPAAAVEEVTSGGNTGGGGVLAALTSLFGGSNDPNLTDEQNQSASRQARLRAGLQGLILSSRGDAGLTEILATAALTGQDVGTELRTSRLTANEEEERKTRIKALVASGALRPEILQSIIDEALVRGDTATVNAVTGIVNSITDGVDDPNFSFETVADPDNPGQEILVAFDKNNPSAPGIKLGNSPPKTPARRPAFTNVQDVTLPDGRIVKAGIDPLDNTFKPVPISPALDGFKTKGKADSTRDRILTAVVSNKEMFNIVRDTPPPGILQAIALRLGLQELVGDEQQQLSSVGEIISRTYVFMLSGVTARETEVKAAKKIFMPQRGDKPGVLRIKRLAVDRLEAAMNNIANGTASPSLLVASQNANGASEAEIMIYMRRIADGEFATGGAPGVAPGASGLTGRPNG